MNPLQREKLARVQGHLNGYADGLAAWDFVTAQTIALHEALREDAQALSELLDELTNPNTEVEA